MKPKDIIGRCSALDVCEKRSVTDDYCELVFYAKDTDAWGKALGGILGPAIKLPGARPSKEDLRLTQDRGGINIDQTLFRKDIGDAVIIAMFWPWRDSLHTTLKIALIGK